jgi:hypothetical protein
MADDAQQPSVRERLRDAGTAYLVTPLQQGLFIAVGGTVLLARAVRRGLGRAAEECERQIEWLNGSVGRAATRVWPWRRASGKASRAALRSTR